MDSLPTVALRKLAARFSVDEWEILIRNSEFNRAIAGRHFESAETIAHRILTSAPRAQKEHDNIVGQIRALREIYLPAAQLDLENAQALPNAPKAVARAQRRIDSFQAELKRLEARIAPQ